MNRIATFSSIVLTLATATTLYADNRRDSRAPAPARVSDAGGSAVVPVAEQNARQQHDQEREIPFAKLVRGNPALKEIALTFDDGPHGPITDRLLDLLKKENVPATFFLVGKMVDRYPGLVRREAAEGHEVANHTYDHLRLPVLPGPTIEYELKEGAEAVERAVGSAPRLYRPPGGEYDRMVIEATKRLGYVMVLWTDDPGDFARPTASIIEERILATVRNGSIVLLHDGIPETLDMLPGLIDKLRKQGYRFVTVSEMARNKGAIITGGPRIRVKSDVNAGQTPVKLETIGTSTPTGGGGVTSEASRRSPAMRGPEAGPISPAHPTNFTRKPESASPRR